MMMVSGEKVRWRGEVLMALAMLTTVTAPEPPPAQTHAPTPAPPTGSVFLKPHKERITYQA